MAFYPITKPSPTIVMLINGMRTDYNVAGLGRGWGGTGTHCPLLSRKPYFTWEDKTNAEYAEQIICPYTMKHKIMS